MVGCEKEERTVSPPIDDYSLFDEYHFKDTTGFDKESFRVREFTDTEVWLTGLKKEKVWIGLFNKENKEQLAEWIGDFSELDYLINADPLTKTNWGYLSRSNQTNTTKFYVLFLKDNRIYKWNTEEDDPCFDYVTACGDDILVGISFYKLLSNEGEVLMRQLTLSDIEGSTFTIGFKEEKVWVRLFSKDEIINEWDGVEIFNRNIKHHLGYGEYEEYKVNYISISDELSLKTDFGYVFIPTYGTSTGESKVSDVIFLNEGKVYCYSLMMDQWSSKLHDWYNGSILVCGKVVLSPEGKLIATIKHAVADEEIPISYTETIRFQGYQFDRCNLETGELVWSSSIDRLYNTQSDAKITMTLIDKKNQVWKYRCDIVNKDGSQEQFSLQIDIETGKFTYL